MNFVISRLWLQKQIQWTRARAVHRPTMAAHTSRGMQYVEFRVYCAESATVPASSQSFGELVVKVVDQWH